MNNQSETPETNKAQLRYEQDSVLAKFGGSTIVPSDFARNLEKQRDKARRRVAELESWPHCEDCNFPLQDQGTPNGLVCLLCDANDKTAAFRKDAEAGAYKGIEWFACWLLDHAEGETITEEQLRPWAVEAWKAHLAKYPEQEKEV